MFQRRHYNKIAELLKSSREKEKHPKRKYVNLCYDGPRKTNTGGCEASASHSPISEFFIMRDKVINRTIW